MFNGGVKREVAIRVPLKMQHLYLHDSAEIYLTFLFDKNSFYRLFILRTEINRKKAIPKTDQISNCFFSSLVKFSSKYQDPPF